MDLMVSVIVPCYNQAQFLEEAVRSVMAQSFQKWECIIVDDGSPDNTAQVALRLCSIDPRIRYVRKENGGLSSARNEGIRHANGAYILPLDADDKISPSYLAEALSVFTAQQNTALVYGRAQKFGAVNGEWDLLDYSYAGLLLCNSIYCSAVFRKSDWEKVAGYDENLKQGYEDWEFWLRLLTPQSKVVKLKKVVFYYRIKNESMLTSMDSQLKMQAHFYIYKKHIEKYLRFYGDPIEKLRNFDKEIRMYRNSPDYALGNHILGPIRNIYKKIDEKGKKK